MTEHNRESCGDGLQVYVDEIGYVRLQWGGHVDVLSQQSAAMLCDWLMHFLPLDAWKNVPARITGATIWTPLQEPPYSNGVTIADTITIEPKEPTE